MLPRRDLLQIERHTQTESKGVEKLFHENGNGKKKKAWILVVIPEKTDFKPKAI